MDLVAKHGMGALLAKCDIQSAFRHHPVHCMDFEWLGFTFEGAFYYHHSLPLVCSVSCTAFECLSTFLEWCLRVKSGSTNVSHYLDHFLLVDRKESHERQALSSHLFELTEELGVLLSSEKTDGRSQSSHFGASNWILLLVSQNCLWRSWRLGIFLRRSKVT